MKERKSFLLYKDSLDVLSEMSDEQAGKLFKAIYFYQSKTEYDTDEITKLLFIQFKNQFERDNEKYRETCERRAIAGSKGGKQKVANASNCKQNAAKGNEGKQAVANLADSDSVNVSDSVSDIKKHKDYLPPAKKAGDSVPFVKIVNLYHEILPELPSVEKLTDTRKGYIRQRWKQDLSEIEHWKNYFDYVRQSPFLMGKVASGDRRPFKCTLEWLTKPANYAKVAEDMYHGE